jgi:NADH-quinone oxidoreductase subunit A
MESLPLLIIYALLVVSIPAGTLVLSWILGQKHQSKSMDDPYESGIVVTDSARLRFPARFYLVAMFFVIFDLEVIFIVAWAIAFRDLGWAGYLAVFIFVMVLGVVLLYEWRTGALDFGPQGRKIINAYRKLKSA